MALLCLWLSACSSSSKTVVRPENERRTAPNFALKDADGRTVQLSDYHGKVILLNFWATWCGPCEIEIPWFIDFERQLKGQGFVVIGISMDDEGWPVVRPFISRFGVNYPVLLGNDSIGQLYGGIDSLPTTFLVDREGRIAAVHVGLVSKSRYENDIKTVLEGPQRSAGIGGSGYPAVLIRAR